MYRDREARPTRSRRTDRRTGRTPARRSSHPSGGRSAVRGRGVSGHRADPRHHPARLGPPARPSHGHRPSLRREHVEADRRRRRSPRRLAGVAPKATRRSASSARAPVRPPRPARGGRRCRGSARDRSTPAASSSHRPRRAGQRERRRAGRRRGRPSQDRRSLRRFGRPRRGWERSDTRRSAALERMPRAMTGSAGVTRSVTSTVYLRSRQWSAGWSGPSR